MMLTKTKPDGTWSVIGANGKEILWRDVPNELYGAICKLHDYEETDLSPEAVEQLRDNNEWLADENNQLNEETKYLYKQVNALIAENARLKALVDEIKSVLKGSGNNG